MFSHLDLRFLKEFFIQVQRPHLHMVNEAFLFYLYDYIFFLANNTKVNLELVKNKLIESNYINANDKFSIDDLKNLLINKFRKIDYIEAKEDVIPFIKNTESLNIWSSEFFISITKELTI